MPRAKTDLKTKCHEKAKSPDIDGGQVPREQLREGRDQRRKIATL